MKSGKVGSSIFSMVFLIIHSLFFSSCVDDVDGGGQSIKKEKISGFVQKGPFVSGTSILMSELNSELSQTGKVFTSQITNDQGLFEITNIELNSSFVEFSSSGFYFNEVTGEISSAPISLTSISDLSNKSSINVNVLTHLEKKRVENLIKGGKSFSEAKKQAKNEVLSTFSIVLDSNSDFEDYDISKNTEEGGILLAISIILQGNRSVGQLTELLSKIQSDIASDGKLDDASVLNSLKFSTFGMDLAAIRQKVESRNKALNISSSVPDFEKYVIKFLDLKDLKITIEGEGNVLEEIISNPSGREYLKGTTVKLTPIPNEGWVFESWGGDLSGIENPKTILIDGPKSISAKFKRRDYPLNITIEGEGTVSEEIVSSPSGREYPFQTVVKLTPVPKEGWIFDTWGGDLSGNTAPLNITVDKEKRVVARFKRRDYPLNITIEGEGTVTEEIVQNPSGREYPYQTQVKLTPVPKDGWIFESWSGDLSGSEASKTITIDKEKFVSVKFALNPNFYLAENGQTCKCPNSKVGEYGIINGIVFQAVDNTTIKQKINLIREGFNLCTTLVTDMSALFYQSGFNEKISSWDVSSVEDMSNMFYGSRFNQDIKNWDVSKVRNMNWMFALSSFNNLIDNWAVNKVVDMSYMFFGTTYNQAIGSWDVSNVTTMRGMFGESTFNQPIGNWNVGNVEDMSFMFSLVENHPSFDQPIGNWNVSKVRNMDGMFVFSSFNRDISNWCVNYFSSEPSNFSFGSKLTTANKPKWGTCPE